MTEGFEPIPPVPHVPLESYTSFSRPSPHRCAGSLQCFTRVSSPLCSGKQLPVQYLVPSAALCNPSGKGCTSIRRPSRLLGTLSDTANSTRGVDGIVVTRSSSAGLHTLDVPVEPPQQRFELAYVLHNFAMFCYKSINYDFD
jgi:hypothetical protein